jgi:hypothetical protein
MIKSSRAQSLQMENGERSPCKAASNQIVLSRQCAEETSRSHVALVKPPATTRASKREQPQLFCPFASGINLHVERVQQRSVTWAMQHGLVTAGPAADKLAKAKIAHLEALVMHHACEPSLQLAADWTTLFCLLDDQLELDTLGPVQLSAYFARLLAGFAHGEMLATDALASGLMDIRTRLLALGGASSVARFASTLEELFCAFVWEEINRRKHMTPSPDAYRTMRAETVGLKPQFVLGQLGERITLSDSVRTHPTIVAMELAVSHAVGFANDVCTYEKELMNDEPHNLVFVIMEDEGLTMSGALARAAATHDDEVRAFIALSEQLPDFGEENAAVERYVGLLQRWLRGHLDWSSLTGRYRAG